MEKHTDPKQLWRAYSALAELAAYAYVPRANLVPAMNVLLSCLRAAGEPCGNDYPDTGPN